MRKKWVLPLVCGLAGWGGSALASEPLPIATTAAVRALSHEDAARHLPVDIQATVTFFRGVEKALFVQKGDTGVYVFATTPLHLQPGDLVRVRGTTSDSFNPTIVSSDIALLKHGQLPVPIRASWPSLIDAEYDCRWVTVLGTIALAQKGISFDQPMTHLVLDLDGGRAEIQMDGGDPAQFASLLDAQVEITAVAGETFDGKMQQTGVRLNVPSLEYVRVLKRSPVDPWSVPLTPMDKVLRGYKVLEQTPRVRVEGTLTYFQENEMAVLQDGDKSIRVLTSQWDPLNWGDRVEAIGVPFVEDGFLTLGMGQIRAFGPGAPVNPPLVNWDDLASGKYSFNLVSIEGTVVTEMREQARDVYVISVGDHLFSASLQRPSSAPGSQPRSRPPMRAIPLGTKVRVTGVVSPETGDPYNGPIAFSILLRYEDDIATVANPPWLNVRHLSELVGLLLLIVFIVGLRAWLVERGTRRKIAGMAYLEQRRAAILEMINSAEPLTEILKRITELASASLGGAPCWCQVVDGARVGNCPPDSDKNLLRVAEHPVSTRAGVSLGTFFAAFDARTKPRQDETGALAMVAGLARLAIETSRLYADLVYRSEFDLLTDVQNRFSLEKFLDEQIEAANRSARIFGLLYVDLDQFKQVNDLFGHQVGDLYLQEVARRLKQQLRPDDMLARLGGDEFAALTPHVRKRAEVEEIAHRLERCFAQPFHLQDHVLSGSASVGIAIFPEDGVTRDSLLTAADASMYEAKRAKQSA
ncbi:MAG: diguanylate cyclase domain-containing protein [Terracidiphilus sp.]